jgi:mono/diheme cytochrome c family protein
MSRLRVVCTIALPSLALPGLLALLAGFVAAQQPSGASGRGGHPVIPPIDPAIGERGQTVYAANCASCHGPDARGTVSGVDLVRASSVRLDPVGAQLGPFLARGHKNNSVPPIRLTDAQVSEVAMYFRVRIDFATAGRGNVAPNIVVGNTKDGETYFNGDGKCGTCHSVTGDLKGVGSKYSATMLQNRIVLPRGRGPAGRGDPPEPARTVTITLADGSVLSGTLVNISDFLVTYRDGSGVPHTVTRNGDSPRVTVHDTLEAHIDNMRRMTTKQMQDLTAYLVTK